MIKKEKNKLDKLIREIINERDNGICQFCNKHGNNVHHVVGRRNFSTRWLPDNCLLLCPLDHTFGTHSFHQDPLGTMEWFKNTFPQRYKNVQKEKNKIYKKTFEEVLDDLRKYQEMDNGPKRKKRL